MTSRAFASHFRARALYSPNISSGNCGIERVSRIGESFGTEKEKKVKVEKPDSVDKKISSYVNVVQKMKLFMKRILKNGKEDSNTGATNANQ